MTFQTEFPDFDATTLPAIPEGWTDTSWHNDICPSFNTGKGTYVFVDFADIELREFDGCKRFSVHTDPEVTNSNDVLFESDDWADVLKFVDSQVE